VLRDAFAAQLAGVFAPFADFAAHRLQRHLQDAGRPSPSGEDAARRVEAAWQAAEPFPDVGPGVLALQRAGLQVAALANGAAGVAAAVLARAGVDAERMPLFDVAEAKAW
jgi:hypothetical protein